MMGLSEMWEVDLTPEGQAAWFYWHLRAFPAYIGNKETSVLLCLCIPEVSVPYMLIVAFDSLVAQLVPLIPMTFQGAFRSQPLHPKAWTARGVSTRKWVNSGSQYESRDKTHGRWRNSMVLFVKRKMGLGSRALHTGRERILEVKGVKALLY